MDKLQGRERGWEFLTCESGLFSFSMVMLFWFAILWLGGWQLIVIPHEGKNSTRSLRLRPFESLEIFEYLCRCEGS